MAQMVKAFRSMFGRGMQGKRITCPRIGSLLLLFLVLHCLDGYGEPAHKGALEGQVYYLSTERTRVSNTRVASTHRVVSLRKGREFPIFESTKPIDGIAISNSGEKLALSQWKKLTLIDTAGNILEPIDLSHRVRMQFINWSPGDDKLYYADFETRKADESEWYVVSSDRENVPVESIYNIYEYDIRNGKERRLTNYTEGNSISDMILLRDGTTIIYLLGKPGIRSEMNELIQLDIGSGASSAIGFQGGTLASGSTGKEVLVVSQSGQPVGNEITDSSSQSSTLYIFDLETHEARSILKADWVGDLAMNRQGNEILLFKSFESGGGYPNWSLFHFDLTNKKLSSLLKRDKKIRSHVMWYAPGKA